MTAGKIIVKGILTSVLSTFTMDSIKTKVKIEDDEIATLEKDKEDELAVISDVVRNELSALLIGQKAYADLKKGKKVLLTKGQKIDSPLFEKLSLAHLEGIVFKDPVLTERVHEILERYRDQCELCQMVFEQQISRFENSKAVLRLAL